jgi:hypothetical protein
MPAILTLMRKFMSSAFYSENGDHCGQDIGSEILMSKGLSSGLEI